MAAMVKTQEMLLGTNEGKAQQERPEGLTSNAKGMVEERCRAIKDTACATADTVSGVSQGSGEQQGKQAQIRETERSQGITDKAQEIVKGGAGAVTETVLEILQESGNLAAKAEDTVMEGGRATTDLAGVARGTAVAAVGKAQETLLGSNEGKEGEVGEVERSQGKTRKAQEMVGQGTRAATEAVGEILQESVNSAKVAGETVLDRAQAATDKATATTGKAGEMLPGS